MKTTLTKEINGDQLQAEIGATDLWVEGDDLYAEGCTQQQLDDGLAAHVPNPDYGKPAEDIALNDELGTKLDQLEADLTTGWAALTTADKTAALRRAGILAIRMARYLKRRT